MSGFRAVYDEESTRVEVSDNGAPFRIAVLAAVEEVAGVIGDLDEGDQGGRLDDDPNLRQSLEEQREYLDKLTERDVGGKTTCLNAIKKQVLEALVAEGNRMGYIDLLDCHDDFCADVQKFLEGRDGTTLDELLEYARDVEMNDFLKAMGQSPDPACRLTA